MDDATQITPFLGFLVAAIRLSTPLLLAATGELVAERAGVLNLGVEGMMLSGALCAFLGVYFTGLLWFGWLVAMIAGALMAVIFAYFAITLRSHQVIVGLGINLLAAGSTGFAYRTLFGIGSATPQIPSTSILPIPLLSDIPYLGPLLFQHTLLVYLAFCLVLPVWWVLFRTPLGLTLRAVGEKAHAADTAGINVHLVQYSATAFGGALAGLAGAYLSTVALNVFLEGMTGGAGWIAVAIVIFGNWHPLGIVAAALTFGGAEALQLRLQSSGLDVPREFIVMLPYVLTIVALAGAVRRSNPPAQLCIPYQRGRGG
jgi:simple sugar transport system permease protein